MTKCLETHRACQESVCVCDVGEDTVAFFHKELLSGFGYGKSCTIRSKAPH